MSVDVIAIRGLGDKEGEEILDPLLSTVTAALARAAQAINAATPIEPVTLETTYRAGWALGQSVEVSDSLTGDKWRGQIISLSNVFNGPTLYTRLSIERLA